MDPLEKINCIDAVCFFPKDFEATRKFFEEVWGLEPKRIQPPSQETENKVNFITYSLYSASVALWDQKEVKNIMGDEIIGGEGHNYMVAVKLSSAEEVDKLCEHLLNHGATCIKLPNTYNFGAHATYFFDNEKNIWEFFAWDKGGDGPALV